MVGLFVGTIVLRWPPLRLRLFGICVAIGCKITGKLLLTSSHLEVPIIRMVDLLSGLDYSDPAFAKGPAVNLLERGECIAQIILQFSNILDFNANEMSLTAGHFART